MANVYATKSGNWSDTTVWNTSALPATVDDVYANTYSVTIDINSQVLSIRTLSAVGITQGGRFFINNGISLSADVITGSTTCLTFLSALPNSCTLFGSVTGGTGGGPNFAGVLNSSSGTINIFATNIQTWGATPYGFAGTNAGILNSSSGTINIRATNVIRPNSVRNVVNVSTGTVNITGNCQGSGTASNIVCVTNSSTGLITITGNVSGGEASGVGYGVLNDSTGTVNIFGDVFSGFVAGTALGAYNTTTGTLNIIGNITARGTAGVQNNSTGTVNVTGNITASQTTANQNGIVNNGICTVYGNVRGGPEVAGGAGGNTYGINNSGIFSNLTIYGNVSGAGAVTASGYGVFNNSSGVVSIIGNIHGRVGQGAFNNGTGTINVTGNVIGGPTGSVHGMQNGSSSTGTIFVNGNAIGGTGAGAVGIVNNIGGRVFVNGNAIAGIGSLSYGVAQNGTGYVEINGLAIGNGFGLGSVGINSSPGIIGSQTGTTIIRGLSCGPRGQWPTAGNVFIIPQSTSTVTLYTSALSAGPSVVLFTSLSTNIVPPASSVRLGTRYNLNDYTGTCSIPSISSVLQGVAVDNSVGIAALQPQTIWNYSVLSATDVDSLGGRLKEVATVQSVGQQLTALN